MSKPSIGRRTFLINAALVGTAAAASLQNEYPLAPSRTIHGVMRWQEGNADAPPGVSGTEFRFFAPAERAFIEAAVSRLIPNDEVGPGAVEAGVPFFLDRQLAGP